MATTARKKSRRPARVQASKKGAQFQVRDGQLVVRLSKDQHPEVFDANRLMKSMRKVMDTYGTKRNCRDLVEFLEETEKSLEILLRNHIQDAMKKYLK